MKESFVLLCLLVLVTCPVHATPFWSDFMHSQDLGPANNHASSTKLFCHFTDSLTTGRQLLYKDGGAIAASDLLEHDIAYLPELTAEVLFNGMSPIQIGFKAVDSHGDTHLAPVKFTGTTPNVDDLSTCTTDATGDAAFSNTFLDLVSSSVTFDDTKLYIGLENNGGGFPTSQNFVFYSYMGVLSEPNNNAPDQTVFGLMYTVTQAGIISPGLYKITGTGITDLERIGNITVQMPAGTNYLILSCLWSDLLADADFSSWFTNTQTFGFMTMTQRITLTDGTEEADRNQGAMIYPVNEVYIPTVNEIPVLYDAGVMQILPDPDPGCLLTIRYHDANDDVPLQAKAIFDDVHEFDFIHMGESINGDWIFETNMDVTSIYYSNWHSLTYRFWYTATDYVDTTVVNTANEDETTPSLHLNCNVYPNPFAKVVNISIDNPKQGKMDISIYNIRGQLVKCIYEGMMEKGVQNYVWNSDDSQLAEKASGVYFLRVSTAETIITKKIVYIN